MMRDTEKNDKKRRIAAGAVIAAAGAILVFIYMTLDPGDPTWGRYFPKCPVKMLTGLNCPSCGIQRAVHALLHGDMAGALRLNFFIPFSLLYLLGMGITRLACGEDSRWRRFFWGLKGGLTYIGVYVVWFIVRNILGI